MPLTVKVTEAPPPVMEAEDAARVADGPEDGAVNVTRPPLTSSSGLLAVTVTASGFANTPKTAVCGVLPATGVSVKPWLSTAPMSGAPTRPMPR